ncbi:MAG: DUF924 domain-containing protein, partial [Proteobacteria bacterium]|nr:DUF924 domain-containing protein [Pseudomonadota bacterium]
MRRSKVRDSRHDILHFWFEETDPSLWFQHNDAFDTLVRERYLLAHEMARDGLCDTWKNNAEGCLALCLLLNQFPRNMFRGQKRAYETDGKALLVSKYTVAKGFDQVLPVVKRRFIYLPYEHSEHLSDQKKSVELFGRLRKVDPLGYERALKDMHI